jgi:transposase
VFECAQGLYQLREGFRLYWYRSSEKALRDEQDRTDRLAAVNARLALLNMPGRRGPRTEVALLKAANKILVRYRAEDWFDVVIKIETHEKFTQTKPGKPSQNTVYQRLVKKVPKVAWNVNQQAIDLSKAMDGVFPLVTNTQLLALDVLKTYKYQPKIEKRHSLFKSVLEIAPVFLKKNERIDALIERTVRKDMATNQIASLPVLPENRPSKFPSAEQIFGAFEHCTKHQLYDRGKLIKTFADPLSQLQRQLLRMLDVDENRYP